MTIKFMVTIDDETVAAAQAYVGNFLKTFKEYPPRMKSSSFSIDMVMATMQDPEEH